MKTVDQFQPKGDKTAVSIQYNPGDKSFHATYNDKNIMAIDLQTLKTALSQASFHKMTSNWVPMIIVQRSREGISYTVKFFGVLTETNIPDKYVVSDIMMADTQDPSTWKPALDFKPWENDGQSILVTFTRERLDVLSRINNQIKTIQDRIIDEILNDHDGSFIDAVAKDSNELLNICMNNLQNIGGKSYAGI